MLTLLSNNYCRNIHKNFEQESKYLIYTYLITKLLAKLNEDLVDEVDLRFNTAQDLMKSVLFLVLHYTKFGLV